MPFREIISASPRQRTSLRIAFRNISKLSLMYARVAAIIRVSRRAAFVVYRVAGLILTRRVNSASTKIPINRLSPLRTTLVLAAPGKRRTGARAVTLIHTLRCSLTLGFPASIYADTFLDVS